MLAFGMAFAFWPWLALVLAILVQVCLALGVCLCHLDCLWWRMLCLPLAWLLLSGLGLPWCLPSWCRSVLLWGCASGTWTAYGPEAHPQSKTDLHQDGKHQGKPRPESKSHAKGRHQFHHHGQQRPETYPSKASLQEEGKHQGHPKSFILHMAGLGTCLLGTVKACWVISLPFADQGGGINACQRLNEAEVSSKGPHTQAPSEGQSSNSS